MLNLTDMGKRARAASSEIANAPIAQMVDVLGYTIGNAVTHRNNPVRLAEALAKRGHETP